MVVACIAFVGIFVGGCAADDRPPRREASSSATTATTRPATTTAEASTTTFGAPTSFKLTRSCVLSDEHFDVTVSYPDQWYAAGAEGGSASCSFLHHEPFVPPLDGSDDVRRFDVFVKFEYVPFEAIEAAGDSEEFEVLFKERLSVGGRTALHTESRALVGGVRGPAGARSTSLAVRLDEDAALVMMTTEVGGLDYPRNADLVRTMAEKLEVARRRR